MIEWQGSRADFSVASIGQWIGHLANLLTMEEIGRSAVSQQRVSATLIAGFTLGMLIGVRGVYFAGLVGGVLVGVAPTEAVTLVAVAAGRALVAMVACCAAARRVLRIQPAQALRHSYARSDTPPMVQLETRLVRCGAGGTTARDVG